MVSLITLHDGLSFDVDDRGAGDAVILLHGSQTKARCTWSRRR